MRNHVHTTRLVAGTSLALACLLAPAISLRAQTTNWTFESGTTDGWTLRSRHVAPAAPNDPTVAGDESLTGARLLTGLPVAGSAWSVGNFNQYNGQIRTVPINGIVDPSDTNLMTYGAAFPAVPNARGQTNYLNTYALNQHGDALHSAANDQIARSPVVTLPANAVLLVWNFGGGNSSVTPALDVPGEEYMDNSGGIAVRSAADDSLLASTRTLAQGTLRATSLNLNAFAGQTVYFELVDAYTGSFGWTAVDEVQVVQNSLNLPPGAFTFEGEDFNFDNGQYIDNPNLTLGDPNCYYQKGSGIGVEGVDFHEANPTVHFGVGGVEWRYDGFNSGFANLPQTTNSFDAARSQYTTAGVADFDMANNAVGEWWNYTRTFPNTNGHLYVRVAAAGPFSIRLDEVSNPTQPNQTLTTRGWFMGTGDTTGIYQTVPLTDITGTNQLVLGFNGTPRTLRMTALTGGFIANFYALDPTNLLQNLIPPVNVTSHTNDQVVTLGVQTTITATATDDGSVTNVQFYAGGTLIGATNNAGPSYSIAYTPSGNEGNIIIRVVATDNGGLQSYADVTVNRNDPSSIRLKTNVGNGADNRIQEHLPDANGGGNTAIEVRRNLANNNHTLLVYRFDLSGYDLSQVNNVSLNFYAGRSFSNWRVLLLGVLPGATNWNPAVTHTPDTYIESALTYNNMPGMLPPDAASTTNLLTYDWDTSQVVIIETNQFTSTDAAPLLTIGTNLTQYLRSQVGQTNIVLMIEEANEPPGSLLGRTMSKEATSVTSSNPFLEGVAGDFAPYLRFTVGAAPTITIMSSSLSGNQLTLNWTGGTGPYKVQKKTLITDVSWTDEVTGIAGSSTTVTISLDAGDSGYYQVVGQ